MLALQVHPLEVAEESVSSQTRRRQRAMDMLTDVGEVIREAKVNWESLAYLRPRHRWEPSQPPRHADSATSRVPSSCSNNSQRKDYKRGCEGCCCGGLWECSQSGRNAKMSDCRHGCACRFPCCWAEHRGWARRSQEPRDDHSSGAGCRERCRHVHRKSIRDRQQFHMQEGLPWKRHSCSATQLGVHRASLLSAVIASIACRCCYWEKVVRHMPRAFLH